MLNLDEVNTLDVVCSDLTTINEPIFLWRILNKVTKVEHLIELINEVPLNHRFDKFKLDLPNDLDLKSGEYEWYIYQSALTGDVNYSDMNLLSSGDLKINTNFEINKSYEPIGGSDKEYNG